ncbi:ral GTPase-activating protein subunit alpha-1-like isoform X2 [Gordionus sp. m RMFG-2023]|uniref:ral GTPase-activating protein subunit alpha-1-like isoform X2 n=1 Tax=Gordionus sp. m RMFG-2023 TaxID=3053472 RepID=UPI0031FD391C
MELILETSIWEINNIMWHDDSLKLISLKTIFYKISNLIYPRIFPMSPPKYNIDLYSLDYNPLLILANNELTLPSLSHKKSPSNLSTEYQRCFLTWLLKYCRSPIKELTTHMMEHQHQVHRHNPSKIYLANNQSHTLSDNKNYIPPKTMDHDSTSPSVKSSSIPSAFENESFYSGDSANTSTTLGSSGNRLGENTELNNKIITIHIFRDFLLSSDRQNINFILNAIRLGLRMPTITYNVKEQMVQLIRSWLLDAEYRPLFMQEEPEINSRQNPRQIEAGFQKCVRVLLCVIGQVFLIVPSPVPDVTLQSINIKNRMGKPALTLDDQYEISKKVLNLFRQVVMATPLNEKSWKCIITALVSIIRILNSNDKPDQGGDEKKSKYLLKYGNNKLLGAFIQTLMVTFIKACLNIYVPLEMWVDLSTTLVSLIGYDELFIEWTKTMDTLFKIYAKHVFDLDLSNLPSDRLTEQKAKKRRGQLQNNAVHNLSPHEDSSQRTNTDNGVQLRTKNSRKTPFPPTTRNKFDLRSSNVPSSLVNNFQNNKASFDSHNNFKNYHSPLITANPNFSDAKRPLSINIPSTHENIFKNEYIVSNHGVESNDKEVIKIRTLSYSERDRDINPKNGEINTEKGTNLKDTTCLTQPEGNGKFKDVVLMTDDEDEIIDHNKGQSNNLLNNAVNRLPSHLFSLEDRETIKKIDAPQSRPESFKEEIQMEKDSTSLVLSSVKSFNSMPSDESSRTSNSKFANEIVANSLMNGNEENLIAADSRNGSSFEVKQQLPNRKGESLPSNYPEHLYENIDIISHLNGMGDQAPINDFKNLILDENEIITTRMNDSKCLPVMLGGVVTGWNAISATLLWKRMLGILGNVNTLGDQKIKLRFANYLSELYDRLLKIRDNQHIIHSEKLRPAKTYGQDEIDSPNKENYDNDSYLTLNPPLIQFFPWAFQACSDVLILVRKMDSQKEDFIEIDSPSFSAYFVSAFTFLFKIMFRRHETIPPLDMLTRFYFIISTGLHPLTELNTTLSIPPTNIGPRLKYSFVLASTLMQQYSKRIYSHYLPGSTYLLYPTLIHSATALIFSQNDLYTNRDLSFSEALNDRAKREALTFLGTIRILCLPLKRNQENLQLIVIKHIFEVLKNPYIKDTQIKVLSMKILTNFLFHRYYCIFTIDKNLLNDNDYKTVVQEILIVLLESLKHDNINIKLMACENLRSLSEIFYHFGGQLIPKDGRSFLFKSFLTDSLPDFIINEISLSIEREVTSLKDLKSNSTSYDQVQHLVQSLIFCLVEYAFSLYPSRCKIPSRISNDYCNGNEFMPLISSSRRSLPGTEEIVQDQLPVFDDVSRDLIGVVLETLDKVSKDFGPNSSSIEPKLKDSNETISNTSNSNSEIPSDPGHDVLNSKNDDPDSKAPQTSNIMQMGKYFSKHLVHHLCHFPLYNDGYYKLDSCIDEMMSLNVDGENYRKNQIQTNENEWANMTDVCNSPSVQFYILNETCLLSMCELNTAIGKERAYHHIPDIRLIVRDECGKYVWHLDNLKYDFFNQQFLEDASKYMDIGLDSSATFEDHSISYSKITEESVDKSDTVTLSISPNLKISSSGLTDERIPASATTGHDLLKKVLDIISANELPNRMHNYPSNIDNHGIEYLGKNQSKYIHLTQLAKESRPHSEYGNNFESKPSLCSKYKELTIPLTTTDSDNNSATLPKSQSFNYPAKDRLARNSWSSADKNNLRNSSRKLIDISKQRSRSPTMLLYNCRQFFRHNELFNIRNRSGLNLIRKNGQFIRQLKHLDSLNCRETYKIAVIYVAHGQEDKASILSNTRGSKSYEYFLSGLGMTIDVNEHKGFNGGLISSATNNPVSTKQPLHGIYYATPLTEIIYHVATRLNSVDKDEENIHFKMKHIGNDEIHVVWSDHFRDYRKSIIPTEFCDILIIIYPVVEYNLFSIRIINNRIRDKEQLNFGPLFDGAIVDESCLAPLVRQTALNANRYIKSQNKSFQHNFVARSNCLNNIISHHKLPSSFENLVFSSFYSQNQSKEETKIKTQLLDEI